MTSSTITSKGQITIPKKIREKLNLKKGDSIDFQLQPDGNINLIPHKKSFREVYGILERDPQQPLSVKEMDEGIADYFKNKYKSE